MGHPGKKTSFKLHFSQIAWVVKDVEKAKTFFEEMLGLENFSETVTSHLEEYDATYYGESSNAENLVAMSYSGGTFIELIQFSILLTARQLLEQQINFMISGQDSTRTSHSRKSYYALCDGMKIINIKGY